MKKPLRLVLGLFGLLVALALLAPFLITWNQYKNLIEEKASAALGREVKINGDVRFGLLPVPFAKITDVVIANPAGAASAQFAAIKSIDVGVALVPLLSKNIRITHIDIKEPAITLEIMADGKNNWQFVPQSTTDAADATTDARTSSSTLSIDDFKIDKGYIRYIDVPGKSQQVIGPVDGKFKIASMQGPISGSGQVTLNETLPVHFDAQIDTLPVAEDGVIPFNIDLDIASGSAKASIKGQFQKGDAPSARAETAVTLLDVEKLVRTDGKTPGLPSFLKNKSSLTGLVTWQKNSAAIGNLMFNSGGLEVQGSLIAELEAQKTITLDLTRVVLPPELAAPSSVNAKQAKQKSATLKQKLENNFRALALLLDTALPKTPINLVVTAAQLSLPNQPTMRDLRLVASFATTGATFETIEVKLPGDSVIKLSGHLPARADGKIDHAEIDATITSQNIEAAMGNPGTRQTPVNARATILLSRQDIRLHPLQIVQNGQTMQGNVIYNPSASTALIIALKGSALDLDAFMAKNSASNGTGKTTLDKENASSANPLSSLQGLKAAVTAELGQVTYQRKTARDVTLDATLSEGGLQLDKARIGDLGGMMVQAHGRVGRFSPLGDADITAKATTQNLSQTLRALGNEAAQNLGASDFDVRISGSGNTLKLAVNGKIDQGKITIDGTVTTLNASPGFDGRVTVSHPETATILRNFGGLTPATSLGPFALKGDMTYGADTFKANGLVIQLGSAGTLQGAINILPQGNGRSISANLKADKLALAALTGSSTETSSQQASAQPVQAKDWSRDPVDLSVLRNLNGQATIAIGELLYKKFIIRDFQTDVKFAGNTINVNALHGSLFDAGTFSINGQLAPGAKNQAHRGNFNININDTDAKKLFEALGSKPFSEGVVDLEQKIAFNGASPYDIIRSLDGDGTFKVTDGVVNGIDLDALAAKLDRPNSLSDFAAIMAQARAGGQTKIGNLTAPVLIRNGIGSVNNITIKTEKTAMALNGSVNLPLKTVDITGQITFVEQRNLPPLTLRLKGPMDAPVRSFDTASFTQFYAQKATAKLQERAGKELNKLFGIKDAPTETPAETPASPSPASDPAASPAAETTVPATPAPAPQKPEDALKQLGGQMLQDLLGGKH